VTLVAAALLVAALAAPAAAHHIGAWTPRDNAVSLNFKQIKFALQERKFDVARRLYETGQLRRELRARAATLPAGLDTSIQAGLAAGDGRAAQGGLTVFFLRLVHELAVEADRQTAPGAAPAAARAAAARRFLEAIWRYYNLVDFDLSERDPRAATGVRLAFEEAEETVKEGAKPDGVDRVGGPLRTIARIVSGVIEASATTARRDS
jgi:hypothetical protein